MNPIYRWFFKRLDVVSSSADETVHLLSDEETAQLMSLETKVTVSAALIGAMGVVVLFVPKYIFPQWFPDLAVTILGRTVMLPIVFTLWSACLVFVEILILTLMHIYCIHKMAVITGFLTKENKSDPSRDVLLLKLGCEKKDTSISRYGIDPLEGMNKKALLLFNLLLALKATLSNVVFKFVIQRMLGRYAFQWIKDMAGIPVFAAWNAVGTRQVLRQGRIVIMGQNLVDDVSRRIFCSLPSVSPHEALVFQTLKLVAISKRDYHYNHAALVKNLVDNYQLSASGNSFQVDSYLNQLRQAPHPIRELCAMLTVLGFLLDGNLSRREKKRFIELKEKGLVDFDWTDLVQWNRMFVTGQGLDPMLERFNFLGMEGTVVKRKRD